MNLETIIYKVTDGVCTLTFNRPDSFNAFNDQQSYDMQAALKSIEKDKSIRVVVLTGAGKAFCSGQDLKSISGQKRSLSESLYKRYNPIIRAMRQLPLPIICRLNGVAAGAGCSLALACDIIVASNTASMIEVFVNVGLVLDSGSSYFLPRVVGSTKAFEMSTMGTKISAEEAYNLGIINKVVPLDELDQAVQVYTDYYKKAPTKAIGLIKKMLNKSGNASLDEMLDYEAYCQEIAGRSKDYTEGVQSFVEKRKANFIGE